MIRLALKKSIIEDRIKPIYLLLFDPDRTLKSLKALSLQIRLLVCSRPVRWKLVPTYQPPVDVVPVIRWEESRKSTARVYRFYALIGRETHRHTRFSSLLENTPTHTAHVASYASAGFDSQHLHALFANHRFVSHAIYLAWNNGIIPIATIQWFLYSFILHHSLRNDSTYLEKNTIFMVIESFIAGKRRSFDLNVFFYCWEYT